jgi:hypothetical protein
VDFVSVPHAGGWDHYALEINVRKGGTTHSLQMLQFLTGGLYDAELAQFRTPTGESCSYFATDNLVNPLYRRLTPDDLFEVTGRHGLGFDPSKRQGVVFSLIGAMSEFGKLGLVAIERDRQSAQALFRRTVHVLDEEAARD